MVKPPSKLLKASYASSNKERAVQPVRDPPYKGKAVIVAAVALALFTVVDALAFRTALYHNVLDPASSTGSFESAIAQSQTFASDPDRDVLVLGDSRIYSGLQPQVASASAGSLRFLNGGVPGTTPRCWPFFVRAIDPQARRFRAVVIAVDTYADDDSAIGSLDGDDRPMDLRYVVFQTRLSDLPKLAGSFSDPRERVENGINLFLRGQELRDDVQSLVADPPARAAALAQARASPAYEPLAAHPRNESLSGLVVNFQTARIEYPPAVSDAQRSAIETQTLAAGHPSPSYARYRMQWLEPIAARYAATGTPVIFVRIPTRPAHRNVAQVPSGSLLAIAAQTGARFLPAAPYMALEQPSLFADEDHLNAAGSVRFSALLGRDVAVALAATLRPTRASPSAKALLPARAHPQHRSLSWFAAAAGIGIPLPFTSYEFWLFFAVVAAIFYAAANRFRRAVLLIASYYFYARWNAWYVVFLWILTLSDYLVGLALQAQRERGGESRPLLIAGVAANLAFLGAFKYANFAGATVVALAGMHSNPWFFALFVPIGISFHTFQSIAYLVDVYRGRIVATRRLFDYALFLAFFPQLLAGPIVRAGLFFGELFSWQPPNAYDLTYGMARAMFGLVKKVAIADQFAAIANGYFDNVAAHPGAPAAWSAMFAFAMQIYFDFSGYSDIAIGCARMLGFVFPENFRMPYLATSITDFWHRWHITLSTWLRDYVYVPLGGNRHGVTRTLVNLMLTMLLGGLWHGAQWTFVVWGGLHGVALCIERVLGKGRPGDAPRGVVAMTRIALTFTMVTLAWVLFRAQSFTVALAVYYALVRGGAGASLLGGWQAVLAAGICLFAFVHILAGRRAASIQWQRFSWGLRGAALAGLLLALQLFSWPGISPTFIYFKF
jgi:alginate O-acetyltransferase complex protein AlgI